MSSVVENSLGYLYHDDRCLDIFFEIFIRSRPYFSSLKRGASSASFRRAFASFFALFFSSFASFFASFCLVFSAFSSSFCRAFSAFSRSFSRSFSFFDFCTSWTTDIFGAAAGRLGAARPHDDADDVDVVTADVPLGLGDVSSCVTIF